MEPFAVPASTFGEIPSVSGKLRVKQRGKAAAKAAKLPVAVGGVSSVPAAAASVNGPDLMEVDTTNNNKRKERGEDPLEPEVARVQKSRRNIASKRTLLMSEAMKKLTISEAEANLKPAAPSSKADTAAATVTDDPEDTVNEKPEDVKMTVPSVEAEPKIDMSIEEEPRTIPQVFVYREGAKRRKALYLPADGADFGKLPPLCLSISGLTCLEDDGFGKSAAYADLSTAVESSLTSEGVGGSDAMTAVLGAVQAQAVATYGYVV